MNIHNGKLAYSATLCGGLPVINVLQRDLRIADLRGLKGIFNATSNFVLEKLEQGGSLDDAVRQAQKIGAAEADTSLDIGGYDTANKLYIIMKSFTNFSGDLEDIKVKGIRNITRIVVEQANVQHKRIKLLALAEKEGNNWHLSVQPAELPNDSFLGQCNGWEMGIQLQTDLYEELAMKIYEEDPIATSAAVLRDIINMQRTIWSP